MRRLKAMKNACGCGEKECEYIAGRLEVNPSDFVLATCMVERVANLSRYVDEKDLLRGRNSFGTNTARRRFSVPLR